MLMKIASLLPLIATTFAGDWYCDDSNGCGHGDDYYQSHDWMGKIPDSTKLTQMSIPGTHDTMALYGNTASWAIDLATCNGMGLKEQLDRGIRLLDIRASPTNTPDGPRLLIFHGAVYQHANMDAVLEVIQPWLLAHPTETIIFKYKQENSDWSWYDFSNAYDYYVKKYNQMQWFEYDSGINNDMTLGQVRGKIVSIHHDFPGMYKEKQDNYKVNTWDKSDKKNSIIEYLEKAQNDPNSNTLYVNYFSGVGTGNPLLSPRNVADSVNNRIGTWLEGDPSRTRIGWILMDFPGPKLITEIIKRNPFTCNKDQEHIWSGNSVYTCGSWINRYWIGGDWGEYIACPSDHLTTGMCSSGSNADCDLYGTKKFTKLQCSNVKTNSNGGWCEWYGGNYGETKSCGGVTPFLTNFCGSGSNADCDSKYTYGKCCKKSGLSMNIDDCQDPLKGSWGEDLVCRDGYAINEFCGSGSNGDCGGYWTTIKCCKVY